MENPKKRILIAEDDSFISEIYKINLENAGFEIIIAESGHEAVNIPKETKPNLILLDLLLPGLNGFEILEKLKKNPETSNIPVIILSNLSQKEDIEKAKSLGAIDYIVKSETSSKEIVRKLKEILCE